MKNKLKIAAVVVVVAVGMFVYKKFIDVKRSKEPEASKDVSVN